ncbi:MAG TPA: hypothetical protein PKZ52_10340 [Cellvibrionaceae bacterium]|nr:hypothetical protein [Cellvibrionaceae bacterium]
MQTPLYFTPYKDTRLDTIYNLQFCDNDTLLHSEYRPTGILAQLLNAQVSNEILQTLAMNGDEDTRIRLLAFAQLRKNNIAVPQKILLATIVEVGLADGLEMLTVYDDRRVRYISAKGRLAVVESPTPPMELIIQGFLADSQKIINHLNPCDDARHTFPSYGRAKMTFIASDGIYIGEAQFKHMQENPEAAKIIDGALDLLHEIIITGNVSPNDLI